MSNANTDGGELRRQGRAYGDLSPSKAVEEAKNNAAADTKKN